MTKTYMLGGQPAPGFLGDLGTTGHTCLPGARPAPSSFVALFSIIESASRCVPSTQYPLCLPALARFALLPGATAPNPPPRLRRRAALRAANPWDAPASSAKPLTHWDGFL